MEMSVSNPTVSKRTKYILGAQHLLAMFGATVLVPFLTGMDPALALLGAGLGTLIFHYITGGIVPVFLGSSFAFISATSLILAEQGIGAVKGGIIVTGLVYVVLAAIVKGVGVEAVKSFFPAIITGPIIILIGLRLSSVAVSMAGIGTTEAGTMYIDTPALSLALISLTAMIATITIGRSFFKLVPLLVSIATGYVAAFIMDATLGTSFINSQAIADAGWLGLSDNAMSFLTVMPVFDLSSIITIAPIAIVVFMEHLGDIATNGSITGKNFFEKPGIHRTLLGDGLATLASGLIGAPVNTTYSENAGVLAVTKVYDPSILRIAAFYAIALSFMGKLGALIQNIPGPVMGGISIILFGMIATMGVRTLATAKINFTHPRNLAIVSVMIVAGSGISDLSITPNIIIGGLPIAGLMGIALNKILPKDTEE